MSAANGLAKILNTVGGIKTVLMVLAPILASKYLPLFGDKIWDGLIKKLVLAGKSGMSFGQLITKAFTAATASVSTFQAVMGGLSAVLGVLAITYSLVNQAHQKYIQNLQESASRSAAAAKQYKDDAESLDELINKYESLTKTGGSADELKRIQSEINDLIDKQGDSIDRVNKSLKTQLGYYQDIAGQIRGNSAKEAAASVVDAERALMESTKYFFVDHDLSFGRTGGEGVALADAFGIKRNADLIEDRFDTVEDFVQQYKRVESYRLELANGKYDLNSKAFGDSYDAANAFLNKYRELYQNYIDAKLYYDSMFKSGQKNSLAPFLGITASIKNAPEILSEIQDGYDGISEALSDMDEYGVLTAKTLENLYKLQEENKLAGLDLEKILIRTKEGYQLDKGALDLYIQSLIESYEVIGAFASAQDRDNQIENVKTLIAVLKTLALAKKDTKSLKDQLNDEKEARKNELDAYKELIDLRKELIKSYQDELDYQKELEKKQKNVSKLQSQLAVSQLDNTAAGRARSRELANELSEAQDDLDDFTLDHAVELVLNDLDDQYEEYKKYIDGEVDRIESSINNIGQDVGMSLDTLNYYIGKLDDLIQSLKNAPVVTSVPMWEGWYDNGTSTDKLRGGRPIEWYETHHSGGIVGNIPELKSTESFAKLLKGEFVSTPAQMKNFMEKTLPQIANFSGGTQQFNAPLVEIKCDSITQDAMPKLQEVVDQAVEKVKKVLNNGLSRTGYMKPATSR